MGKIWLIGVVAIAMLAAVSFAGDGGGAPDAPDLVPQIYAVVPEPPYLHIDYRTMNIGTATAGESYSSYTYGIPMFMVEILEWIDYLEPNTWVGIDEDIPLSYCSNGGHIYIDAWADIYNEVAESNENNNHVTYTYNCQTGEIE